MNILFLTFTFLHGETHVGLVLKVNYS